MRILDFKTLLKMCFPLPNIILKFSSQDTVRLVQGGRSPLFHETTAVSYSYALESGLILCLWTSTETIVRPDAQLHWDRWCQIFQIP